jgi:hypothetical protein
VPSRAHAGHRGGVRAAVVQRQTCRRVGRSKTMELGLGMIRAGDYRTSPRNSLLLAIATLPLAPRTTHSACLGPLLRPRVM